MIARLVNEHAWRIGVVAQSHAVVENLFGDVIAAGVDPDRGRPRRSTRRRAAGRRSTRRTTPAFIADTRRLRHRRHRMGFRQRRPGAAAGARPARRRGGRPVQPRQHHRGGARPRNLLLLGDPQQLPQVSQGTHPEPVDTSALGWLIDGRHTLPAELGYFLDLSYRMHPDVCAAVSRLSYDDRLHSDDEVTAARSLDGHAPGVRVLDRRPRRQLDRQPRRGRRHRRRDRARCSAPRGPTSTAPAAGAGARAGRHARTTRRW